MISLNSIKFSGSGLRRPECVIAHASGLLFTPDWTGNGGISIIKPDGHSIRHLAHSPSFALRPNGIALESGGTFLLAHLGDATGGIYRLFPDGHIENVVTDVDGLPMPPANFVCKDESGRLWFTVSTRVIPRGDDYRRGADSGFIALHDPHSQQTRIVADGLGYANECIIDSQRQRVLVNETFARRLSAFELADDGTLSHQRTLAEFGTGTYPDGMALDQDGHIWVVSIVSNRVIRIAPDGTQSIFLEDSDEEHLAAAEAAWLSDSLGRPHLDNIKSELLKSISNIAFGGKSLDQGYFGCLLGDSIAHCAMPVKGLEPVHWQADIQPLMNVLD